MSEKPRITLRPFRDDNIALLERWLHTPHVAKWIRYGDEWIDAQNNRRGEFSFITPFIAEYKDIPIGFCRYFDCYHAKNYPVWNEELPSPEQEGEEYSMDILIGEPEYMGMGFGKQMTEMMLDELRNIGAKAVIIRPETENTASNHILETIGFKRDSERYVFKLNTKEYTNG